MNLLPSVSFPEEIRRLIVGYEVRELLRRRAQARVWMLDAPDQSPLILKAARNLSTESDRINWLNGCLPVPEVIAFATATNGDEFLLMTRLSGIDGTDAMEQRDTASFIEQLAVGLLAFHNTPHETCPWRESVPDLIELAERKVQSGSLRGVQLSPTYLQQSPENLLRLLRDIRPESFENVLTHGDPSLPNFMFDDAGVSGFIDLGLVSVSDPYRDLAIVSRTISWNLGQRWVRRFFKSYGAPVDPLKIEFYLLLDEFIMARPVKRDIPGS